MAKRDTYHHGDLRRAVLDAALDVVRTEGPGALSLRELARRAGVSHAAPAHHFKDRAGLLTAIAVEGFRLLTDALGEAEDLREAGVRYVEFAFARPAHFQVMFRPDLVRAEDPELVAARAGAAERLRVAVEVLSHEGRVPDARSAGVAAWSLAHGYATLALSHNLPPNLSEDPAAHFRDLTDLLFNPPAPQGG
ncbi:TetR/AcrR family transcriptional regulator (plasmid) [Streptomyces sp. BI20]|uniref:TetR/AcrR family transcriptional regulator n=1 Tax=Streptomyces sp. BI20 TaxID=3403460 RepID=UPI003C71373E